MMDFDENGRVRRCWWRTEERDDRISFDCVSGNDETFPATNADILVVPNCLAVLILLILRVICRPSLAADTSTPLLIINVADKIGIVIVTIASIAVTKIIGGLLLLLLLTIVLVIFRFSPVVVVVVVVSDIDDDADVENLLLLPQS